MNAQGKPTLLLIDGHSLAFRAFYALSPDSFKTSAGQHTNAVHGFISMMLNILQAEKPTHLAVAFDLSRSSFRTDKYPAYKGTRGETPPEFNGQTELLQQALESMNIKWITKENYEADDIIATLAKMGDDAGFQVYVVSGDRDTFQLITPTTTILYPVKGVMNLARMDDAAVYEKYGVHAAQYPELAALVGETSDNLPGIPGVGPKTAAKWIQEYGSLQAIFDNAANIPGKVGESLREHMQEAVRNRELNHLLRDLPLPAGLDDFHLQGLDESKVRKTFASLEFRTLTERVLKLRGIIGGTEAGTEGNGQAEAGTDGAATLNATESMPATYVMPEQPESNRTSLDKLIEWASTNAPVAIDLEFAGLEPVSIGAANSQTRYVAAVSSSEQISLKAYLEGKTPKVAFGAKDLERKLLASGVSLNNVSLDPMLLGYLVDPLRRSYALDDLVEFFLQHSVNRGDANALIPEAGVDVSLNAWLAFILADALWVQVQDQNQDVVYEQVEAPSSSTLARMEAAGVKIDVSKLEALLKTLTSQVATAERECFDLIGKEINLASPKQLQTVLFEDLGMTGNKKVKTGFSTNAESLNTLFEETDTA